MKSIQIADRTIEAYAPPLVIAEIGVNHDGSLARALELVKIAADCGADAVKLQIFRADFLMNGASTFAQYQKDRSSAAGPAEMLRRYELPPLELCHIVSAIRDQGMIPIATPFSLSDVDLAAGLHLDAIKIASPDLVNRPLLERASSLRLPLLVSTGAASIDEVATSTQWMNQWRAPFALMHCTSSYPTPSEHANLAWIAELAEQFDAPCGFSDHTTDVMSGALAVAAGACLIERHLTYDQTASGPDHSASSNPKEFTRYVRLIRTAHKLRGQPGKCVLPIEQDVRNVSRQSLVAARDLAPGQALSTEDLIIQRPGTGIPAAKMADAIGRRTARLIRAGTLLDWTMLTDAA